MSVPGFEPGTTRMFTWTASSAPDAAPTFSVARIDEGGVTGVATMTALQSSTTAYYGLYTMPSSEQQMRAQFFAQKTISGSTWTLIDRLAFNVRETRQ